MRRLGMVILVSAAIIGGCGGATGSSASGSTSPDASPNVVSTGSVPPIAHSAVPSPMASDVKSLAPGRSTGASGPEFVTTEPTLRMTLPDGWRVLSAAEIERMITTVSKNATGPVKAAYDQMARELASGELRGGGAGPSGLAPWSATLLVEVSSAASLEALIDRVVSLQAAFVNPRSSERTTLPTALGSATRVQLIADPPTGAIGGVPARGLDYFLALPDGRFLWLNATGPEGSTTFEAMIDAVVSSVRRD